jgi:NAD+--asparagine ADP-ribosyltransferase
MVRKRKERRGLAFKVTTEFMNEIFNLLKKKKYKLVPKDAEIHSISNYDMCWDGYTIIMTSKEFPVVPPECNCDVGYVKVDKEKGIIELKERK